MKIDYEDIVKVMEYRKKINECKFEDLRVYKNGFRVYPDEDMKAVIDFSGFNNFDLVEIAFRNSGNK